MKISVIIPVYNTEKYISRCLDSILYQSLHDLEVIIVNDCTPDGAMQIVNEYVRKDKRLRIIDNPSNLGLMMTRRVGYKQAMGDYVVFCDSDDYLPIDALEKMYDAIEQSRADIVVSSYTYIDVHGTKTKIVNKISGGFTALDAYLAIFNSELKHSLCAKIYSRRLFADYEYETFEKQTNAEDFILFCQLLRNTAKIECIEVSTYNYCQNLLSASQFYSYNKFLAFVNAINWQYQFFKDSERLKSKSFLSVLDSILGILKAGCKQEIILKINPEILDLISLPILYKYMNLFNPTFTLLFANSPFTRFSSLSPVDAVSYIFLFF